ncbi:hypothetical protein EG352_07360 [Chryseobacterium indologenes]|uniref:Uncharacterized protein n=1 Tax=Chryseobacterium indologenes TaxID=253 RepID=A0AAD0YUV4_CHRID|nr:hypothetical protein [Chryseobacterium indologenes]AZB17597.1 hypothetical protein EG352_07360 [Chryseobacterium indologenes]
MITNSIMREHLNQKFTPEELQPTIWMHTNYRTGNIFELTPEELESLYYAFFPKQPTIYEELNNQYTQQHLKSLRSVVLKDAQYIGLYDPQDWTNFNRFMLELSPLKKALNKYTADEFEPLIKQFKSLRSKYNRSAKIPGSKEWCHKNRLPLPSKN